MGLGIVRWSDPWWFRLHLLAYRVDAIWVLFIWCSFDLSAYSSLTLLIECSLSYFFQGKVMMLECGFHTFHNSSWVLLFDGVAVWIHTWGFEWWLFHFTTVTLRTLIPLFDHEDFPYFDWWDHHLGFDVWFVLNFYILESSGIQSSLPLYLATIFRLLCFSFWVEHRFELELADWLVLVYKFW